VEASYPIAKKMKFIMKKRFFLIAIILLMALGFKTLAQSPIRVVCIGNSITAGYRLSDPATQAWPAQLASKLGSGYSVLNCGVSGTMMLKNSASPYWNTSSFTDAQNFNPQILIISLGTNDANVANWKQSEFYEDYVAMINVFRANGKNPVIYVCCPTPDFGDQNQNVTIETQVIPFIKQISTSQGATLIDFHTPMLSFSSYFTDGLHPNAQGAAIMGQTAYNVISGCLQLIVPGFSVNGAALQLANSASVKVGDAITISPQPVDGTWIWTGPNGFTSTSRVITLSNIQLNQGGVYTANYISAGGCKNFINFLVTLSSCTPATLTPYIQVNTGGWGQITSVSANAGSTITFGPQASGDGTWTWAGPNGFYSNLRQFSLSTITSSQAGNYTATFVNATGCITTKVFSVAVCTPIIPYINVNNFWAPVGNSATVKSGDNVTFGPQPLDAGVWTWTGPGGFSASTRQIAINSIKTNQAGNYITNYTYTNSGCTSTETFHIIVDGVSEVVEHAEENDRGMYPNPATDQVTLINTPANSTITIIDLYGQNILNVRSSGVKEDTKIDIKNLKTGTYLIKTGNVQGVSTFKLIKQY
jgi:lysophospholipase L1-like esterase